MRSLAKMSFLNCDYRGAGRKEETNLQQVLVVGDDFIYFICEEVPEL